MSWPHIWLAKPPRLEQLPEVVARSLCTDGPSTGTYLARSTVAEELYRTDLEIWDRMPSIRVLIADHHASFHWKLRQICELEEGVEVVGEARNGREAVALAHQLRPDLVLMDAELSILDSVQAIRLITTQNPSTRVVALTTCPRDERVLCAIKAGAYGCLSKDAAESTLIEAIRAVHRGEALIDPAVTAMVFNEIRRCQNDRTL